MKSPEPDPLVTQCPHCDTRFRVTENQLVLAEGRVRCGACLLVFVGADYLQLDSEFASSEEAERSLDEVLNELDENELDSSLGENLVADESAVVELKDVSAGDSSVPVDDLEISEEDVEDYPFDDDPDALIQDTQEFPVFSGPEDGLDEARKIGSYEDVSPSNNNAGIKPFVVLPDDAGTQGNDNSQHTDGSNLATAGETTEQAPNPAKIALDLDNLVVEPAAIDALYSQLLHVEKPRPRWIPVALFVGFVAIVAQVFYYQFDTWGKNRNLRPVYGYACQLIGCQLPVIRSLADIRSRSSSVRPHPHLADVLAVEALIVNEAGFAQPFPTVELRFTTLLGNTVTTYSVTPIQYLEGELSGVVEMEPLQPVRIAFEVPDPGSGAENYAINFL